MNNERLIYEFDMVQKLFQIERHPSSIYELNTYLPTPIMKRTVFNIMQQFGRFKSRSVSYGAKGLKLSKVRPTLEKVVQRSALREEVSRP